MSVATLADLQASVQDKAAFGQLADYAALGHNFLAFLAHQPPTRIVSPSHANYIFFQYDRAFGHRITRPLNTNLFIEFPTEFDRAFERLIAFLGDLRRYEASAIERRGRRKYVESKEINRVIYTAQQIIGSIGDSFDNPNQSRKRIGQLFENLVRLTIQEVGLECEPRSVNIPLPDNPGLALSYELDMVFSRNKAILASETQFIQAGEIVGSVKTTSKDRIDKIFLDKYLLTKLLGRPIPVVAVFLNDVQRAARGGSIFGINSTFKSNHFLGYSIVLSRLDGVYYVDPLSEMTTDPRFREQISDFQQFLVRDLWTLSAG